MTSSGRRTRCWRATAWPLCLRPRPATERSFAILESHNVVGRDGVVRPGSDGPDRWNQTALLQGPPEADTRFHDIERHGARAADRGHVFLFDIGDQKIRTVLGDHALHELL